MLPEGLCNGLGDLRHKPWVLQLPDRWIARGRDVLELVMPVKMDFPAELCELIGEPGIDEVDRAIVYT
jgi:hypothetical protein